MLEIKHLNKSFPAAGSARPVIGDLNFTVESGEFYTILGQSGCGKSTLLRLIGGFDRPDSGEIWLDGRQVTAPSKDMMMVFQSFDQLFPWYTLEGNLIYALKKVHTPMSGRELSEYARKYLDLAGLAGFENSYPHQLSGGMKQRGALARALCLKPAVLLMDEPFSSLDYITKRKSYGNLKNMAARTGTTVIMVTHDIEEALILGSAIAVFSRETRNFREVFRREQGEWEAELQPRLEEYLM